CRRASPCPGRAPGAALRARVAACAGCLDRDPPAGELLMSLGLDDLAVGHWTDPTGLTGCTVVIPPPGNVASVSVRGGGPGTRETDVLGPSADGQGAGALLLTGGSAFGLAAADGVAAWCERRGMGYGRFG